MTTETSGRRLRTQYAPPLISWEEYVPWALANEFPSEWVDGRIIDVLTQNVRSSLIVQFLFKEIERQVKQRRLDGLLFNFLMWLPNRPSGRVPDLMYISADHMYRVTQNYLDGPADLAIEVMSVDSLVRDRCDKFLEYQAGGVREYWLIDEYHEEARFYVLDSDGQYQEVVPTVDGVYTSAVLPDVHLSVEKLWHAPFKSLREHLLDKASDPTLPRQSTRVPSQTNGRRTPARYAPPMVSWEDFHDWAMTIEGRAEWVDGEIVEVVGDSIRHFFLVHFLANLISRHVELGHLGKVFIETVLMKLPNRPTGRMPDVFFIANSNRDRIKDTFVDGPADLAIEVVSKDSEIRDRFLKLGEYEDGGIPEYWLIDLLRSEAHFYILGAEGRFQEVSLGEDGLYESSVLPGLSLRVNWLWRDPLPTLDEALADLPA